MEWEGIKLMFEKSTPNLGLPQWSPKDHPDFLTDMNNAFKVLDERVHAEDESADAIAQLVEKVNKLTEDLTAVTADVELLKDTFNADEIEQMRDNINTLTDNVANITTAIQNHAASITEITSHLSVIDSDITAIKSTIVEHTSRISNNETMVTNLNTALSALEGTVNGISTLLSTVETDLQTAQSDIDELDTRIIATNAAVSSLQTDVTQVSNNAQTALNTANTAHTDAENAINKINQFMQVFALKKYTHTFSLDEMKLYNINVESARLVISLFTVGNILAATLYGVGLSDSNNKEFPFAPGYYHIDIAKHLPSAANILINYGGITVLNTDFDIALIPKGIHNSGPHKLSDFTFTIINRRTTDYVIGKQRGTHYAYNIASVAIIDLVTIPEEYEDYYVKEEEADEKQ